MFIFIEKHGEFSGHVLLGTFGTNAAASAAASVSIRCSSVWQPQCSSLFQPRLHLCGGLKGQRHHSFGQQR